MLRPVGSCVFCVLLLILHRGHSDFLFENIPEILCLREAYGAADFKDFHVCRQQQLLCQVDPFLLQISIEADSLYFMEQFAEIYA